MALERGKESIHEFPVSIPVSNEQPPLWLEARMGLSVASTSDEAAGVVICHPHPLYGGV